MLRQNDHDHVAVLREHAPPRARQIFAEGHQRLNTALHEAPPQRHHAVCPRVVVDRVHVQERARLQLHMVHDRGGSPTVRVCKTIVR